MYACLPSDGSAAIPDTPTLTSSPEVVSEGVEMVLTCASTTPGISGYRFSKDGSSLADSASNTYTVTKATASDSGTYSCDVTKDGVTSIASSGHVITVAGEWNRCLVYMSVCKGI